MSEVNRSFRLNASYTFSFVSGLIFLAAIGSSFFSFLMVWSFLTLVCILIAYGKQRSGDLFKACVSLQVYGAGTWLLIGSCLDVLGLNEDSKPEFKVSTVLLLISFVLLYGGHKAVKKYLLDTDET